MVQIRRTRFTALFRGGRWSRSSGELSTDSFYPVLVNIAMQPHNADIFLIVLEEKRREAHCIAEHDEKHSGNLWVKCSCMPYLAAEHLPYPRELPDGLTGLSAYPPR